LDHSPPPKQGWILTSESFDMLLLWLNPDREKAGQRYEEIRSCLIKGFRKHGCEHSEELADETINRVAKRVREIAPTYVGDPARYFYGVAHNVHLEYLRRPLTVPLAPDDQSRATEPEWKEGDDFDSEYACLEHCIEQLPARNREMILTYYQGEQRVKILLRQELAQRLGIKLTNLRLQAQRVRTKLKKCILDCLSQKVSAYGKVTVKSSRPISDGER
jgi:RNA polymerase sigma factor (sigma-70 family)